MSPKGCHQRLIHHRGPGVGRPRRRGPHERATGGRPSHWCRPETQHRKKAAARPAGSRRNTQEVAWCGAGPGQSVPCHRDDGTENIQTHTQTDRQKNRQTDKQTDTASRRRLNRALPEKWTDLPWTRSSQCRGICTTNCKLTRHK